VETSLGRITAKNVVNAAGFYAPEVAELAGHRLPIISTEHQYIVSRPLPEVEALTREMPVLRLLEASTYVRMERQGLLLGTYEKPGEMKMRRDWYKDGVPGDFSKQLFDDDIERQEPYISQVMEAIPCLERAQFQSVVNGPITYTPDGLGMVGPSSVLPNMWLAAGLSFGIIQSGGLGKYLAEYIVTGEPPQELIELDPARFELDWLKEECVEAKVEETYGRLNHAVYPNDERPAGRPSGRVSTAYTLQKARGASFLPHSGWEQPAWFAGEGNTPEYKPAYQRTNWHEAMLREYRTVMEAAGVIDLTSFAKFRVSGPQAAELLNRVTANSLPRAGRCVVTHCLTQRGTVYAELTITALDDTQYLVVTGSGSEGHDWRWLKEKARLWGLTDVSFANVTEDVGCLGLAGPKARTVLQKSSKFPDKFPFFSHAKLTVSGIPVDAIRLSYSGEDGWELYHDRADTGRLYEALLNVGRDDGVDDFGTHAINVLRQEKGFRAWQAEMTCDTNLVEVGYQSFVDLKKGDFHGRDAYVRQTQRVPEKVLVPVAVADTVLDPMGDEAVYLNNHLIGTTTSGCFSPALNGSLAYCFLPPFVAQTGSQVEVELLGRRHAATVLPRPPVASIRQRLAEARRAKRG